MTGPSNKETTIGEAGQPIRKATLNNFLLNSCISRIELFEKENLTHLIDRKNALDEVSGVCFNLFYQYFTELYRVVFNNMYRTDTINDPVLFVNTELCNLKSRLNILDIDTKNVTFSKNLFNDIKKFDKDKLSYFVNLIRKLNVHAAIAISTKYEHIRNMCIYYISSVVYHEPDNWYNK